MAKRDKDGKWTYDDDEEGQISMMQEAVRRDRLAAREEAKAEEEASKPCEICGKAKGEGEHGEGKCKKPASGGKKKFGVFERKNNVA